MEVAGDTSTEAPDYEAASDRIVSDLSKGDAPSEGPGISQFSDTDTPKEKPIESVQKQVETQAPKTYDVPKTWRKDAQKYWPSFSPEAQAYILEREEQIMNGFRQMSPIRDAVTPHLEYLNKHNIQVPHAISSLLQAHRLLTEGTPEQRRMHYERLGQNLGIIQAAQAAQDEQVDPRLIAMQNELAALRENLQSREQREIESAKSSIQQEVDKFAADADAHPYFDEVAKRIAEFVSLGMSLEDAYDEAVWANPTTRAKEQARLIADHEKKLKENARLEALPKKKAASVNLSSSNDGKIQGEPLGTIQDTIRGTLRQIRNRAS